MKKSASNLIGRWQKCALLVLLLHFNFSAFPEEAAILYQGRLTEAGSQASGLFDFEFRLFDREEAGAGARHGPIVSLQGVPATNGLFTVSLDFGADAFDGTPRFLEISVRRAGSTSPLSVLAPRQRIAAVPYSLHSVSASRLDSGASTSFIQANASGSIGIGTAEPKSFLHLYYQPDSLTQLIETGGRTNAWAKLGFRNLNGEWDIGTSRGFNNDVFYIDRLGNSSLEFQLSPRGYLGLGIEPFAKLHLYEPDSVTHLIESGGGINAWSKVSFRNANGQWDIGTSRGFNGDQFYVSRSGASGIAFAVQPNGDGFFSGKLTLASGLSVAGPSEFIGSVGIGTPTPIAKLHVENPAGNTAAVYGHATGPGGVGVYAQSSQGAAIHAEGNASQALNGGGFVKAMVFVNRLGNIVRCFSSQSSGPNCGINVAAEMDSTAGDAKPTGQYVVDFGFDVSQRFISITTLIRTPGGITHGTGASFDFDHAVEHPTRILLRTFSTEDSVDATLPADFMVFVF